MSSHPQPSAASKALVSRCRKLLMKKYRDREGLFIAEGLRTVEELLRQMPDIGYLEALLVEPALVDGLVARFPTVKDKVFLLSAGDFSSLSGTKTSQGVIGVFRKPARPWVPGSGDGRSLVVALDDIQDPGNVGTILRTAAWFGAEGILCSKGTADVFNPKAVRSSAGSIYSTGILDCQDLAGQLRLLQEKGYRVVSASLGGTDLRAVSNWPDQLVLVIGNEANGVSPEVEALSDSLLVIPRLSPDERVESLNAAVSAAVFLTRITLQDQPAASMG